MVRFCNLQPVSPVVACLTGAHWNFLGFFISFRFYGTVAFPCRTFSTNFSVPTFLVIVLTHCLLHEMISFQKIYKGSSLVIFYFIIFTFTLPKLFFCTLFLFDFYVFVGVPLTSWFLRT